jgi:hypothetical protein
MGVGGLLGPFSRALRKYDGIQADSRLLRQINQELDLPQTSRYTSIVIQGTGTSLSDDGRSYRAHLGMPENQLARLPPLLQTGHDGAVHCISAQLNLTPTAARYENATDLPVAVRVCRLPIPHGDTPADFTVHTAAVADKRLWDLLLSVMDGPLAIKADADAAERQRHNSESWVRDIALHLVETDCQRRYPTGRIGLSELTQLRFDRLGQQEWRCRWRGRCETSISTFFSSDKKTHLQSGSFRLLMDRFERPESLADVVMESLP